MVTEPAEVPADEVVGRVCGFCGRSWPQTMKFCGECGTATEPSTSRSAGELRQLTIVFCDLVGSTRLSGRLDLEDLRDSVRRYQRVCHAAVADAGGYVGNYLGDGILAYFGAPNVLEDAALRAVDAALAMVRATSLLTTGDGEPLVARAALNTGQVILGPMGVGRAALELDITGEAVNIAARLEGQAPVGSVVISGATAEMVAGHFELEPLGELQLKGIDRAVPAHLVLETTGVSDRLEARAAGGLTTFVGREAERHLLVEMIAEALDGRPDQLVIVGEPGIGKSRLVREVCADRELAPTRTIVVRGVQDRAATPFDPVRRLLSERVDLEGLRPPDDLTRLFTMTDSTASVGVIETARERRARMIGMFCDWLWTAAEDEPLIVVVEDLQWVDPSTLELIDELHSSASIGARLAIVGTARSGHVPAGAGAVVELDRLAKAEIDVLVSALGVEGMASMDELIGRAEGVPLYLEEIAALARRDESLASDEVPATIADLLASRLEDSGENDLARDCSVFGREVSIGLASRVLDILDDQLQRRLDQLVRAGVMRLRADGETYSYRHGLLRDAAYRSLVGSERRHLHNAAAEAIQLDASIGDGRYEAAARHLDAADSFEPAWRAWRQAAEAAGRRNAHIESLTHYEAAISSLLRSPPGLDRDRRELNTVLGAGPAAFRLHGAGAPATAAWYARAEDLTETLRAAKEVDVGERFGTLAGVFAFHISRPNYGQAAKVVEELQELVRDVGPLRLLVEVWAGATCLLTGDFERAEPRLLHCLETYDPTRGRIGEPDLGVMAGALLTHLAWARGQPEAAAEYLEQAFAMQAVRDVPFDRSWLLMEAAKYGFSKRDRAAVATWAAESLELALAHGFEQIEPQVRCLLAWSRSEHPNERDLEIMHTAADDLEASGSRASTSLLRMVLVAGLRDAGKIGEATTAFDEGLTYCQETGEWQNYAEYVRLAPEFHRVAQLATAVNG